MLTHPTTSLSEKARGKQKAIEPPVDDPASATTSKVAARDIVIRFTEGYEDYTLHLLPEHTVREVKKLLREERPELQQRRLRLIHSGRLLTDGVLLFDWLKKLEEHQGMDGQGMIWLHCSVGPKFEPGESDTNEALQTAQLLPPRGFDRLATLGISPEEIMDIRRQFHNQTTANYLDEAEFNTEEEYDEHARALEEQWMDSTDPDAAALSQASSSTLLQGVLIGFFFPLLPFFFLRKFRAPVFWSDDSEPEAVTNVIFTRSMQMGIVLGFIVNIMFGWWRLLLDG